MKLRPHLRHNQQLLTLYMYAHRKKMWHTAAGVVADTCARVLAMEQKEAAESTTVESTKQNSEEWLALIETMWRMMMHSLVPFNGSLLMKEFCGCSRGEFTEWLARWIETRCED